MHLGILGQIQGTHDPTINTQGRQRPSNSLRPLKSETNVITGQQLTDSRLPFAGCSAIESKVGIQIRFGSEIAHTA